VARQARPAPRPVHAPAGLAAGARPSGRFDIEDKPHPAAVDDAACGGWGLGSAAASTQAGGELKAARATIARPAPGRTCVVVVAVVLFGGRAYKHGYVHGVHGMVYNRICIQCSMLK
jgi:hypothetical protein